MSLTFHRTLLGTTAIAVVSAALGVASSAHAALLAYEPFDYTAGSNINGQNGGIGFTGAWRAHLNTAANVPAGSFNTVAGSLAHPTQPGDLPTVGNSAFLTGTLGTLQPARDFANIAGGAGTTTWISFLAQRVGNPTNPATTNLPGNLYPRGANLSFFDTEATATQGGTLRPERLAVGNSSNATVDEWSVITEGSGGQRKGNGESWTNLHWAVVRIDHLGGATNADNVYLWLDPDPNTEPLIGNAHVSVLSGVDAAARDYSNIDFLRPFIGNQAGTPGAANDRPPAEMLLDEIRIGTTYADMSAVPEPVSAVTVALAAAALGFARRRA